jgi:hypothetical protein
MLQVRHHVRVNIDQFHTRMGAEHMPATRFAEFSIGIFSLVVGGDIVFALGDIETFGRPKAEGIDRRGRPARTVIAMAIPHGDGCAGNFEFNRAAKTPPRIAIGHFIYSHDRPNSVAASKSSP